jgi:arabinose-5-phosphate isomerase
LARAELDLSEGRRCLEIEARALDRMRARLDGSFAQAVEALSSCRGKVIVTGIGKSGQVGRKIASTMSSTGTPALFLHPAESSHGDLGVVASGDVILAISYGGETPELQDVIRFAARKGIRLVVMTGKSSSSLAKAAEVVLDASVAEEACPLGLAPTASSTAALALGDALAMALLKRSGFKEEDFAEYHPGGSLGRRLLTRVADVMHKDGAALPLVKPGAPMREVLALMTQREVRGVAGVVDAGDRLVGVITDGDIRRRLERSRNPLDDKAEDLMSRNPKTVDAGELAEKALFMMEQFSIQTLFVVSSGAENPAQPVGLLHLQDLLRARVR